MPHLSLHLLGVKVVSVVHVLVFAQVCGDLPDLRVELDICVAPLTEHDGILGEETVTTEWNTAILLVYLLP